MLESGGAKFRINIKEGVMELEGNQGFVDKHLDRFEDIFKSAIQDAMASQLVSNTPETISHQSLAPFPNGKIRFKSRRASSVLNKQSTREALKLPLIPVDLKATQSKISLREFYKEKRPSNYYEKTAVFVYYLIKLNKQAEVKYGEILSCYEEVDEKKPSITNIIKNSIRYKGWLGQGSDKYATKLTISGENFVKFDLPKATI